MVRRYVCSDALREKLSVSRKQRMLLLVGLAVLVLAVALLARSDGWGHRVDGWLAMPAGFIVAEAIIEWFVRRLESRLCSILEVDGGWLRQLTSGGRLIGQIDLGSRFTVEPAHVGRFSMLRVRQGSRKISFSTSIPDARVLVEEVLLERWLPDFETQI